jgi:hypothetical protein
MQVECDEFTADGVLDQVGAVCAWLLENFMATPTHLFLPPGLHLALAREVAGEVEVAGKVGWDGEQFRLVSIVNPLTRQTIKVERWTDSRVVLSWELLSQTYHPDLDAGQ